jgi:hypothetical protein
MNASSFSDLLDRSVEAGGLGAEDLRASLGGLFQQAAELHANGFVVAMRSTERLRVDDQFRVAIDVSAAATPLRNRSKLKDIQRSRSEAFEIVSESRNDTGLDGGSNEFASLDVLEPGASVVRPVFVSAFDVWEHQIGHHDELADIHGLGMLLASLALGLDFHDIESVRLFAVHQRNPFQLKPTLHPVIGQLIVEMTDVDRSRRAQDMASLASRLNAYRDQPAEFNLSRIIGSSDGAVRDRRGAIQEALRDRLFEINRRNRLVYFAPNQQSVNLTIGSIPVLLDVRNIRPEQVATWKDPLISDLLDGKPIKLGDYLNFDEAPYLPSVLDKLISQAKRDRAEYGMAQLRLVVCFLRWHNLKEFRDERITSPLLLLPIQLTKKRGVKDSYQLVADSSVAEVNPALRQHLRQLYNISLPETVDLQQNSVDDLRAGLEGQIRSTEPGVSLTLLDRPQLQLIQQRAKLRVDQYRRRQRAFATGTSKFSYSYTAGDFRPLGIQMYDELVRYRSPSGLRISADAKPIRFPQFGPIGGETFSAVKETQTYALQEAAANPFRWDVDLCALTLANFNYRKMTLVRDYNQLVNTNQSSDSFDRIFSLDARPLDDDVDVSLPVTDRYLVVTADETQRAAIARARAGRSFIIQGPPGTGKSQTITNLIADYVARGKRVLFVCEKRAAIDVVHARLRQQGLDELCAVIHDSQADKRPFIQHMRGTYESWISGGSILEQSERERTRVLDELRAPLASLERVEAAMRSVATGESVDLRTLMERNIATGSHSRGRPVPRQPHQGSEPTELHERIRAPLVSEWDNAAPSLKRVVDTLTRFGEGTSIAAHPVADVRFHLFEPVSAATDVSRLAQYAVSTLRQTITALEALRIDPTTIPQSELVSVAKLTSLTMRLPQTQRSLLLPAALDLQGLVVDVTRIHEARARLENARSAAAHWVDPLPSSDLEAAISIAQSKEDSALKFLSGSWRSLKKTVEARYAFDQHSVSPSISAVLHQLRERNEAETAVNALHQEFSRKYGDPDVAELQAQLQGVHRLTGPVADIRDRLASGGLAEIDLTAINRSTEDATTQLAQLISPAAKDHPIQQLSARLTSLASAQSLLGELRNDLINLATMAPAVDRYVRQTDRSLAGLEMEVVDHSVRRYLSENSDVQRIRTDDSNRLIANLRKSHDSLLSGNAQVTTARARERFLHNVMLSSTSATLLSSEDKESKKLYTSGRRELEHEFGKTMRFRSIRDLASGPSRPVVMDLRPIWLMSPLGISDSLPLDPDLFDVVVFDEASQIPIEDAIPALYRAHQTIVVGDQMQLPPTQFFSARSDDDHELDVEDEDGNRVSIVLDGDSFLSQSAAALPTTMLQWHYRSRSEELIGFSNAAFYGGSLATVPDRRRGYSERSPISVSSADGIAGVDHTLSRPITFHHLNDAPYESRRNRGEATYVAAMVKELLLRHTPLTIGIAAFSEAQQGEIEGALERLAELDLAFRLRLEAEEDREDDGQFVGLFVKNLENLQGDERDIIIMSVCYGPGADGRMVMAFGPINQQGGEKRLNVIFSRARHHMAIVSSIRFTQITNEHNDGANTLRRFLQYAEALSGGEGDAANLVLDSINPQRRARAAEASGSACVRSMRTALQAKGWIVDEHVGQSRFRCDLAVRRSSDDDHRLALLVDTQSRSQSGTAEEHALTHVGILEAFGWSVMSILTKDWYDDPDRVIGLIEQQLQGSIE